MQKTAWVIGGGSGLGAELSKELILREWKVAISGRRIERLAEMATQYGALPFPLDVTDAQACNKTVVEIATVLGKIDMVVFSVAAWELTEAGQYDAASFERIYNTNVLGAMRIAEPVIAQYRAQGAGDLVFVSSVAGYFGLPRSAAYSSGKAALTTLAQTMHAELAGENINVRIICPGFVKTELTDKNDFPMPFLMEAKEAGKRMADGLLNSKRFEISFPRRMVWIMKIIRILPYPVFFALMKKMVK